MSTPGDAIRAAFDTFLRDYVTDGVAASGANRPEKSDGRSAGAAVADSIDALLDGSDPESLQGQIDALMGSGTMLYWGGVGGGSANVQTVTPSIAISALTDGMTVIFIPGATNTGAATLQGAGSSTFPATSLKRRNGSALVGGDVQVNVMAIAVYKEDDDVLYLANGGQKFVSAGLAMTAGAAVTTQTHGLGASPTSYAAYLVCTTGNNGYSSGDEVLAPATNDTTTDRGVQVWVNSAQIGASLGSAGISMVPKGGGAPNTITLADWSLILKAAI